MKQVMLDGGHDARELRNALGRFPTGVTVITTRTPSGKLEGLTANSFSALSLDPPLVLWSISCKSASVKGFVESGHFAINVPAAGHADLSHRFARPKENRFEGREFKTGFGGYQHANIGAAKMPSAVELKPRWMAKARALPVSRSFVARARMVPDLYPVGLVAGWRLCMSLTGRLRRLRCSLTCTHESF